MDQLHCVTMTTTYTRRSILSMTAVLGGLTLVPGTATGLLGTSASPRCLVGACNNEGFGNSTLSAFVAADDRIGPLRMRRSFPSLASWPKAVAADKQAGYRSFVSAVVPNGDYTGLAAGKYDDQIIAAVSSLPARTRCTMNHEPENDVPGRTFVKMFQRFYTVAKKANPRLRVGPTHLTYGWRNGVVGNSGNNTGTQAPEEWDVGDAYRDFTAADTYSVRGQALKDDPQFRAWFDFFNRVSNKRLCIAEYGQYAVPPGGSRDPVLEAKRARLIAEDAAWLSNQPKFTGMWLVWNGSGAQGNWKLQDKASIDAWRAVAAAGR